MTSATLAPAGLRALQLDRRLWPWLAGLVFMFACVALENAAPWLVDYPKAWVLPLAPWINWLADWFVYFLQPLFRAVAAMLEAPMRGMRAGLVWLPWPFVMLIVVAVAMRAGGVRLALFAAGDARLYPACRLLAGEHEHPRARCAGGSDVGGHRLHRRRSRSPDATCPAHHRRRPRPHADGAGFRLSHTAAAVVRLRPRRRPHRQRHLCAAPHGAQHHARPRTRSPGHQGGGHDERLHATAAFLACRSAGRHASAPGRSQPDDQRGSEHGDHCRHHRRLRRYRLGGPLFHAQGRVRPKPAVGAGDRTARHTHRPHHAGLRERRQAGPAPRRAAAGTSLRLVDCRAARRRPPAGAVDARWRDADARNRRPGFSQRSQRGASRPGSRSGRYAGSDQERGALLPDAAAAHRRQRLGHAGDLGFQPHARPEARLCGPGAGNFRDACRPLRLASRRRRGSRRHLVVSGLSRFPVACLHRPRRTACV